MHTHTTYDTQRRTGQHEKTHHEWAHFFLEKASHNEATSESTPGAPLQRLPRLEGASRGSRAAYASQPPPRPP